MPVFDLNQQAEIIHPLPIAANLNVRFGAAKSGLVHKHTT
jgi:hypothetical protein